MVMEGKQGCDRKRGGGGGGGGRGGRKESRGKMGGRIEKHTLSCGQDIEREKHKHTSTRS